MKTSGRNVHLHTVCATEDVREGETTHNQHYENIQGKTLDSLKVKAKTTLAALAFPRMGQVHWRLAGLAKGCTDGPGFAISTFRDKSIGPIYGVLLMHKCYSRSVCGLVNYIPTEAAWGETLSVPSLLMGKLRHRDKAGVLDQGVWLRSLLHHMILWT